VIFSKNGFYSHPSLKGLLVKVVDIDFQCEEYADIVIQIFHNDVHGNHQRMKSIDEQKLRVKSDEYNFWFDLIN